MTLPQDQLSEYDEEFLQELSEFAGRNPDATKESCEGIGEFFDEARRDLDSNHQVKEVSEEHEKSPKIPTLLESINAKRQEDGQDQFASIEAAIASMKHAMLKGMREICGQLEDEKSEHAESKRQLEASMSSNFKLKCALGFVSTLLCMSALYILYKEFSIKLDLKPLLTWGAKLPNNIECDKAAFIGRAE